MLSLSTSFISTSTHSGDGRKLLTSLEQYPIGGIELDCRLNRRQFQDIQSHLGATRLQVSSLHNYCPFPALKPNAPPGGDYFKLSSLEAEERKLAIEWTARTIEHANQLEAEAVVLHCGAVEMDTRCRDVYRLFELGQADSQAFNDLVTGDLEKREQLKAPYLDALLFSLDRLIPIAERHGIILGLENRNHYFELPGEAELALILDEFKGASLGYWHDSGHAHVFELIGITTQKALLDTFGDHLVGIHLHDARGLNDHLAPGLGEIDFSLFKPYLKDACRVVIELAPGTPESDVGKGVDHIRSLGHFSDSMGAQDFFLDLTPDFH